MTREQRDALTAWVLAIHKGAPLPGDGDRKPEQHRDADRVDGALRWGVLNTEGEDPEPIASFAEYEDASRWLTDQQAMGKLNRCGYDVFPYVVSFWFRNELTPRELEPTPEPEKKWCRCAHLLARHQLLKAMCGGPELWRDVGRQSRRIFIREAEVALNWAGRCQCRSRHP